MNNYESDDIEKIKKIKELFNKKNLKKTLLFTFVIIIQAMFLSDVSYSALSTFMPILLNKIGTKIDNDLEIYGTILAQTFLGIPGTLISSYLATTGFGKKWTTAMGFFLSGLSVFIFLVSTQYWMVLLSTSFISLFNFMGYSTIMAIIPESYTVDIRSLGVGWANSWCKFGGVVSPVTIGIIFELDGGVVLAVFILSLSFAAVGVLAAFFDEPSFRIDQNLIYKNNISVSE